MYDKKMSFIIILRLVFFLNITLFLDFYYINFYHPSQNFGGYDHSKFYYLNAYKIKKKLINAKGKL